MRRGRPRGDRFDRGDRCPPRGVDPFERFPRSHPFFRKRLYFGLQRRLFLWFGATILVSACVVGATIRFSNDVGAGWRPDRALVFLGQAYADVWNDPIRRSRLSRTAARELDVDVRVKDATGEVLEQTDPIGGTCNHPVSTPVTADDGTPLGTIDVCWDRHRGGSLALPIIVGLIVVWGASGLIARRLTRPIHRLALVADEIGHGQLSSRGRIPRHHRHGEVRVLADALYDMATRIEKQLTDQRALLATVSHELRTPLARIRLLVELARSEKKEEASASLDEVDREIVEIDALVGDLLANSRLDFAAVQPTVLDAAEIAQQAVERTGVDPSKLEVDRPEASGRAAEDLSFRGDPTLVIRAIVNLLENAERHAGGVARFRVHREGDFVVFDVEDEGPGFLPGEETRVFEPFYKNPRNPDANARSTGLGLALVRRIATAHGGEVHAENLAKAGARVGIRFAIVA